MASRVFGEMPGNPSGTTYANRREVSEAGVHRPLQGGICGGEDGAESVVVSGGYVDDLDYGDEIIYTGHGGRDPDTGLQVADQDLTRGNLGLARNYLEHIPVRVVRGYQGVPSLSPATGYRYDGLYEVADFWQQIGKDGFRIWRFRLTARDEPSKMPEPVRTAVSSGTLDKRVGTNKTRASSEYMSPLQSVRTIHNYTCQVCGLRLDTPAGPYAVAAHIRAMSAPHDGPNTPDNILCLCPNDEVRFTTGGIYIDEAWQIHDALSDQPLGPLRRHRNHRLNQEHIRYHRQRHAGTLI